MRWSRGVDTELFRPRQVRLFGEEPVFLYVGRIAVEKNIKAFLDLDLPGRKVLVGSGPQAGALERAYPDALFTGPKQGEDLALAYASADVFAVSEPHRHLWPRAARGLGQRGAGRRPFPSAGPKDVITDPARRRAELGSQIGAA